MRIVWYIGDFYEFANQNGFRASVLGYKHCKPPFIRVGEIFIRISEASYFLAQSNPHMSVVFYLPGKLHIDCKYLSPQTSRSLVNHKINKVIMNKG